MEREILKKYIRGEATPEERLQAFEWISTHPDHQEEYILDKRIYDVSIYRGDTGMGEYRKNKNSRSIIVRSLEYAAVACMVIVAFFLYNALYKDGKNEVLQAVSVPVGQHTSLTLNDGTVIELGSNSKLTFPSGFKRNERKVHLQGSAYFNVAKNKHKPFIVASQEGMVKVTGTTFYVDAFPASRVFKTSLIEGKVSVFLPENAEGEIHLHPGQQAVLVNEKLAVMPIEDYDQFLWREGFIAFKGKTMEEIFGQLQNCYDITIQVKDRSKFVSSTYSGKFYLLDGVDYALQVLQRKADFRYERDEQKQIIYIE
ncbi:FecR domain-containing protein [uncultured Proteiniphilum sp.]|jgi:ferric-dicitrate binding protein FerR (iron transport regulator)|uniref:FecR family protein n=1 Tax=uncultured Proteiniphilum sp. TaxID=497637 RepID=UPI00262DBE7E|nr:FecR domain-containing protein [uncultured Proteiniphilum sp.]